MKSEEKTCQNCKNRFTIEPDDFDFYKRMEVPPPTFCPECRLVRRLSWRNEKSLYRGSCDKCGKTIISVFPKDSGLIVYCSPCWWSDSWDGLEYGMDYDRKRPFILQVRELLQKTPVMNLFGLYATLENSDYTNMVNALKNCYLITHSDYSENCAYGSIMDFCKDSMDSLMLAESELCYETVNCRKCYLTFHSVDCESCRNVYFSKDCVGCSDCVGCVNLRNKKYHIFNKPYSKDEYERLAEDYMPDSSRKISAIKNRAHEFWAKFPQKYMHERHNASVSGDYIYNSKNTHDTFIATDTEDSRFCSFITPPKVSHCYDFSHYGDKAEFVYDSLQAGNQVSRVMFSWFAVTGNQNVEYCIFSVGNKDVFGSVSLKKREYCILNRQYTKEDYATLRARIVEDMKLNPYMDKLGNKYSYGEFFPAEMSPFGYNATTAQELFPLTSSEAGEKGYRWKERERYDYKITVPAERIPDGAARGSVSPLAEVFGCEHGGSCNEQCTAAFKVIPDELKFYEKMKLPLPRLCPNCRHFARLKFRNPMKLWKRKCQCAGRQSANSGGRGAYKNEAAHFHGSDQCLNEFGTSYAPDRPEIVYCGQCYGAEVA